jgi:hypothetical protein
LRHCSMAVRSACRPASVNIRCVFAAMPRILPQLAGAEKWQFQPGGATGPDASLY